MEKMTSGMMRDYNKRQIYKLIYKRGRISRQTIADELELSLPTVNAKLKALEDERLIEHNGFFQSTGGRKSAAYSCVSNAGVAVGAHITKSQQRLVAVDLYGNIIKRESIEADYEHSREYYRRFGERVNSFARSLNISQKKILGVGIALMALLSRDRQSVQASVLLGTSEATIADFAEWIDFPCQLFHDSEAAAGAELWFSPKISDALYLGINHHLNGMLIMNGKIHVGKEYTGGLVEHMTLYPQGRRCYCGKQGCLTTYCSGHVLFGEEKGCEGFFQRLRKGGRDETELWHGFLKDLSIGIGSLYAVLDCDVILGGTVGAYMNEEDIRLIQQLVRTNSRFAPASDFICLGHKDVDTCACGAALYYVTELLENT